MKLFAKLLSAIDASRYDVEVEAGRTVGSRLHTARKED